MFKRTNSFVGIKWNRLILLSAVLFLFNTACLYAQNWNSLGSGLNGEVFVVDSFHNALYASGYFTSAGGSPANYIAKWDGKSWSSLGAGLDWDGLSMVVYNNKLIVGGGFSHAGGNSINNIAQWNDTAWAPLGNGTNNEVYSLIIYNGNVYAAGAFSMAGTKHATNIAKWNGTAWDSVGLGIGAVGSTTVYTMAVYNGKLYVGGTGITSAGGKTAYSIACWNDTVWSDVGGGLTDTNPHALGTVVKIMQVYNGNLYVQGVFTTGGGIATGSFAKWNDTAWSMVPMNGLANPTAFTVYNGNFYSYGTVDTFPSGNNNDHVAKWNGTHWDSVGYFFNLYGFISNAANSFCSYNGNLYIGGNFDRIGVDTIANYIAEWNPIPLGINELSSKKIFIAVFPNPGKGIFQLTMNNGQMTENNEVIIYNTLGQVVLKQLTMHNGQCTIDLKNQPAGIYMYRVLDKTGAVIGSGKLVKE